MCHSFSRSFRILVAPQCNYAGKYANSFVFSISLIIKPANNTRLPGWYHAQMTSSRQPREKLASRASYPNISLWELHCEVWIHYRRFVVKESLTQRIFKKQPPLLARKILLDSVSRRLWSCALRSVICPNRLLCQFPFTFCRFHFRVPRGYHTGILTICIGVYCSSCRVFAVDWREPCCVTHEACGANLICTSPTPL